jgi:signal transduction histidine kinase
VKARDGLPTTLTVSGDASEATASQRIALTRIVHEALRNAVEHGGAHTVAVMLDSGPKGIYLRLHEEGRGFDVEAELADAARRGRLGIVSMGERARLLGGSFDIDSRPGGPTVVSVRLPWWRPLAAVRDAAAAALAT